MLYPSNYVNKINYRIVWVTQKNIEVEENRVLKKEEPKEKIKRNSSNGADQQG
jgi:hypothetical protein